MLRQLSTAQSEYRRRARQPNADAQWASTQRLSALLRCLTRREDCPSTLIADWLIRHSALVSSGLLMTPTGHRPAADGPKSCSAAVSCSCPHTFPLRPSCLAYRIILARTLWSHCRQIHKRQTVPFSDPSYPAIRRACRAMKFREWVDVLSAIC
jgi:hypothetical protein